MENIIIPKHIGIIMDGNGRWAKNRLLPRNIGHKKGAEVFKDIARYCSDLGMEAVTFYAFSTENWKRPQEEIDGLMKLFKQYLIDAFDYEKENVKVSKLIRKYKLTDSEKSYLKSLDHIAKIGLELASPVDEYEHKDYFCRREAIISYYDEEVNYGYTIYKWDGTYNEKPLFPNSDKTFKFKNWVEIFHTHTEKKVSCKEMLETALKAMKLTKEVADEN